MIQTEIKRLFNSGNTSLSINELRVVVAIERAIARIEANTQLANHIVFKGGFVLLKCFEIPRFTRDIDALGKDLDIQLVKNLLPKVLECNLQDGLWYGDIHVQELEDQGNYGGLRFNMAFQIDDKPNAKTNIKKPSRINIDVGFGDVLPANISKIKLPSAVDGLSEVTWLVYPPEYIFSKKLQTVVVRGSANSRAKDIYDLIFIFDKCLDQGSLITAVQNTFKNRDTLIPDTFLGFIKNVDVSIMKNSWNSIVQSEQRKITFDRAMIAFEAILKNIDKAFKK